MKPPNRHSPPIPGKTAKKQMQRRIRHEKAQRQQNPSLRQWRSSRQSAAGGRPGPETRVRKQKIGRAQYPVHLKMGQNQIAQADLRPPGASHGRAVSSAPIFFKCQLVTATISSSPCRASAFFSSTFSPSCRLVNRTGVMTDVALFRRMSRSTSINF